MADVVEFKAWPKTPRTTGQAVHVTEKIDGTNGCIIIQDRKVVGVQSRNRMLDIHNDNFGFCNWVMANEREIVACLGEGRHYGEWAGPGIQQNKHKLDTKTFFLFNLFRIYGRTELPITTVPLLYQGVDSPSMVDDLMQELAQNAKDSGYEPEGIIVYHHNAKTRTKATFSYSAGKWAAA